ncbi:hypothetical protein ILUMI_02925 [Ignelater luminosus]|uniref:PiggyBac transposable element-derived protein domain-containing protein n=1 Tax=Ignelater luminosus TaxID=2038154 RepID=A0A8K0DHA8_IGNLU|nr:hypothetical protein ILUMI_02925 [Ignelater luminosus]
MPPINTNLIDEDSGDENELAIDNLPPSQILAETHIMDNFDIIAAETQDEWDEHDGVPLTNLYAARRNRRTDITHQEVKYFLGILLLSGYCSVSRRRMYRKKTEDCHNKLVAEALSRDRFEWDKENNLWRDKDRGWLAKKNKQMDKARTKIGEPPNDRNSVK